MRDSFLDTSKALLIFLVVFGHFLERMMGWSDPKSHVVLGFIYTIHMPAFIFISGMLFKDKNLIKNLIFFIALYLPFQFLYPLFDALWTGHIQWQWNVFERPYWILWYLMGMMLWTLLTHFLIKTPIPTVIAFVMAFGVGFSTWNNYQYSIGRIFVFFPFFILGFLYGQALIRHIQQQKYAVLIGAVISILIAVMMAITQLSAYWLYGSLSYQQLQVGGFEGSLIRAGCFILSALGIYAVFAWVKCFEFKFRSLGEHTLPVYILHGFVVIALAKMITLNLAWGLELLICLMLSLMSCWILQKKPFEDLLRTLSLWLVKPTERLWKK